tara:strand:+ start:272 stop:796 length:525 start_codon:yes stop_codon:yes gene_type:complete
MILKNLFNIPMWSIPTLNFSKKKKQLEQLVKGFPEKKHGLQTFSTNRQNDRTGFVEAFSNICGEELNMLSKKLQKDIQIEDIWSVSYKKGDYHTPHDHGSTGLAGILYLNMPKKAPVTQYIQPWNDWYSDRTIYYPLPVNEGTIVVTPKFVRHFTEPNKDTKIKRVISWDMKIL